MAFAPLRGSGLGAPPPSLRVRHFRPRWCANSSSGLACGRVRRCTPRARPPGPLAARDPRASRAYAAGMPTTPAEPVIAQEGTTIRRPGRALIGWMEPAQAAVVLAGGRAESGTDPDLLARAEA